MKQIELDHFIMIGYMRRAITDIRYPCYPPLTQLSVCFENLSQVLKSERSSGKRCILKD